MVGDRARRRSDPLGFFLWPSKPTPTPSHSLATAAAVAKANVVLVAPTRTPSSADQMQSADEFKVCNSEFASAQQAPGSETQYEELAATEALGEHVLKALSTGSSLETRALGAWLAVVHARGKAYLPFADRMQLCSTDLECMKAVSSEALVAVEKASRSQVDEMVRQAVDSSSPTIYAMAFSTCHPVLAVAHSPSCQRITSERWTQLDPVDAGPWLHLLEEANARHDAATANEAFYRASIASSLRTGTESFLGYAEPALSSGFSAADRMRAEWDITWRSRLPGGRLCCLPWLRPSSSAQQRPSWTATGAKPVTRSRPCCSTRAVLSSGFTPAFAWPNDCNGRPSACRRCVRNVTLWTSRPAGGRCPTSLAKL